MIPFIDMEPREIFLLVQFLIVEYHDRILYAMFFFGLMVVVWFGAAAFDLDSEMFRFLGFKFDNDVELVMEWTKRKHMAKCLHVNGTPPKHNDEVSAHIIWKLQLRDAMRTIWGALHDCNMGLAWNTAVDLVNSWFMGDDGENIVIFCFSSLKELKNSFESPKLAKYAGFQYARDKRCWKEGVIQKIAGSCYVWIGTSSVNKVVEGLAVDFIHQGYLPFGTNVSAAIRLEPSVVEDTTEGKGNVVMLDGEKHIVEKSGGVGTTIMLDGEKYTIRKAGPGPMDIPKEALEEIIQKRKDEPRRRNRGNGKSERSRERRRSRDRDQSVQENRIRDEANVEANRLQAENKAREARENRAMKTGDGTGGTVFKYLGRRVMTLSEALQ